MNRELPDVQADFRRGRGTRDQIANICWIIKKAREFQKNIYFYFTDWVGREGKRSNQVGIYAPKRGHSETKGEYMSGDPL